MAVRQNPLRMRQSLCWMQDPQSVLQAKVRKRHKGRNRNREHSAQCVCIQNSTGVHFQASIVFFQYKASSSVDRAFFSRHSAFVESRLSTVSYSDTCRRRTYLRLNHSQHLLDLSHCTSTCHAFGCGSKSQHRSAIGSYTAYIAFSNGCCCADFALRACASSRP